MKNKKFILSSLIALSLSSSYMMTHAADKAWADMSEAEKLEYLHSKVQGDNVVIDTKDSNYDDVRGTLSTNVSIGDNNKPLVQIGSDNKQKSGNHRVLIGYNNKAVHNGITIGDSNETYGRQSIAMGYQSKAYGIDSMALGMGARALPSTEVKPYPYGDRDFQGRNVAIGENTVATAISASYGASSASIGMLSTAIGIQAVTGGDNADAYQGALSSVYQVATSKITDDQVKAKYKDYLENINFSKFDDYSQKNLLNELRATMYLEETPTIGATAIGSLSRAKKDYAVALGTGSLADRASFNKATKAPYSEFTLDGKNTWGAVSIGGNGKLRQIINLADATEDTDAVNLRQLKGLEKSLKANNGSPIKYFSVNSTNPINEKNDGAKSSESVAIGPGVTVESTESVVVGSKDTLRNSVNSGIFGNSNKIEEFTDPKDGKAYNGSGATYIIGGNNSLKNSSKTALVGVGNEIEHAQNSFLLGNSNISKNPDRKGLNQTILIGNKNNDENTLQSLILGNENVEKDSSYLNIMGYKNETSKNNSITVIGRENKVSGISNSTILGNKNVLGTAKAHNAAIIGNESTVNSANSFVVGNKVTANVSNSVFLGDESTIRYSNFTNVPVKNLDNKQADGVTTTGGSKGTISKSTLKVGNKTVVYGGEAKDPNAFAGATAIGGISVGYAGGERRIMNVAAGEISKTSTDAINGSQLYLVADKINSDIIATKTEVTGTGAAVVTDKKADDGHIIYNVHVDKVIQFTDDKGNALTKDPVDGKFYPADAVKGKDGKYYPAGTKFNEDGSAPADAKPVDGKDGSSVTSSLVSPKDGTSTTPTKLKNVDKGEISPNSTDAVNGSQLFSTNTKVENIENQIFEKPTEDNPNAGGLKKLQFKGNQVTDIHKRTLGQEVFILGDQNNEKKAADFSTKNVLTESKDDGVYIKISDKPEFKEVTITGGPKLTNEGIDMGDKTITNLSPGKNEKDAVNKGQLDNAVNNINKDVKAAKTEVTGTGATVVTDKKADDGHTIYNVHVEKVIQFTDDKGNALTKDPVDGKFYPADAVKGKDGKYYPAGTKLNEDGSAPADAKPIDGKDGSSVNTALVSPKDGTSTTPTKLKNVDKGDISENSTDAVNGSQLFATNTKVKNIENQIFEKPTEDNPNASVLKKLQFKGNQVSDIHKRTLGDAVLILGDNANVSKAADFSTKNVLTESKDDGVYIKISDKPVFKEVSIVDGPKLNDEGIDMGNKKITNLAPGTDKGDAVNKGQLDTAVTNINNVINANKIHYFSVKADDSAAPDKTNWNNDGAKADNAIAVGRKARAWGNKADNSVAIGYDAAAWGHNNGSAIGAVAVGAETRSLMTGAVALGNKAKVEADEGKGVGGIAIGNEAYSHNMYAGSHEDIVAFNFKNDKDHLGGGIAIGNKTHARMGTIDMGHRDYVGKIGDIDFGSGVMTPNNVTDGVGSTTVGTNSINSGNFSSINGSYNVISNRPTRVSYGGFFDKLAAKWSNIERGTQGFGSTINGTLNSIENNFSDGFAYSGMASSIVGIGNRVNKSNATIIMGAGNEVTNSYLDLGFASPMVPKDSIKELADTFRKISYDNRLGSVGIIGGGNKVDYAVLSTISGVGNTLKGTENSDLTDTLKRGEEKKFDGLSAYNMLQGYENEATNVNYSNTTGVKNVLENTEHVTVTGSKNKLTDVKKSVVLGDENEFSKVDDVFALGNKVKGNVGNSVYLGSGSSVIKDAGKNLKSDGTAGDTTTGGATGTVNEATVNGVTYSGFAGATSTGAVSVGSAGAERRIMNVAAGEISKTSTDAINGSQLYLVAHDLKNQIGTVGTVSKTEVKDGTNTTVEKETAKDGHDIYKVNVKGDLKEISSLSNGPTKITLEKDKNEVNVNGGKITNVADGDIKEGSKDAINGGQIYNLKNDLENKLANTTATANKGWTLTTKADGGEAYGTDMTPVKPGETATWIAGNNIVLDQSGRDVKISVNKDLKVDSVTAKEVKADKATVGGVTIENNKISGLKTDAIAKDDEAVSKGYLDKELANLGNHTGGSINALNDRINMMGDQMNRGLSQASALASLKPLQYDMLEPNQILAGVGYYKGHTSVALGIARYTNESTLIHGGVAWAGGSDSLMANAGISWKFGNSVGEKSVPQRYKHGPISSVYALQHEVTSLKSENHDLQNRVVELNNAYQEQKKTLDAYAKQLAAMQAQIAALKK